MQKKMAELEARDRQREEAHQQQLALLEAQRHDFEQRSVDMAAVFSSLGSMNLPGLVLPPSLLTPFVAPALAPTPYGATPVSSYGCLFVLVSSNVLEGLLFLDVDSRRASQ